MEKFSGSMRMADGSRVGLSEDEAKALWDMATKAKADRAALMPDTDACLKALSNARDRMSELGWRVTTYCPRDGSDFAVCEIGSTGIWSATYSDPYIHYADCVAKPGRSMFFKPMEKLTSAEMATLEKCVQAVADEIKSIGEVFS